MLWALKRHDAGNYRNFQRIITWLGAGAVFWIGGAFVEPGLRLAIWGLALAIEYASPMVYFWVPGLGRSSTADWRIEGAHLAERCGLFVIIALGESILITGATFADLAWNAATIAGADGSADDEDEDGANPFLADADGADEVDGAGADEDAEFNPFLADAAATGERSES